ncbi:MAG: glycosyltransferase family 2 protein, partial [Geminicoccaceae bacterium]
VRYVFEAEQGLSPARNRGWREARGRYVAYVDDECRMPRDWIRNMTATIEAQAPEMLGGPYDACFDEPPPAWYRRPYFSTVWKGVTLRAMGPNEFLAGGNMVIRRDLFDHVGTFDPALGMKGGAVAYGEETAFQKRLMQIMPEAKRLYDPSLSIDHLVRDAKLGIKKLLQQRIAAGRSGWRMARSLGQTESNEDVPSRDLAITTAKLAWHVLIGMPFRKRALYPYPQNYLREVVGLTAARLGRLLERRRDLRS